MAWTFLVVDDNEVERTCTVSQLQHLQPAAEVLTADSAEAAIVLLEEQRLVPSLILLDFAMAGATGITFLSELRNRHWLEKAPVAMLTERIADRHVINCYRLGACAFLTKPVQMYELRETLRDFAEPATRMTSATVVPGTASVAAPSRAA